MTFGPAVGNVGMYVARELLASVPEEKRPTYLALVSQIADLKYQLGVEVARQLPRLLAEQDTDLVARYLHQVQEVAKVGWKSSVEVAKQLPDLYDAPDPNLARAYVDIITGATSGRDGEDAGSSELQSELDRLEVEIREMEPKIQRAQELKSLLASRDRRDEKRKKHAVELASVLPPVLARLRPATGRCFWSSSNRSPTPTRRPPSTAPTPCLICSTASACPKMAPGSGSPVVCRCSTRTLRSDAGTSALAPNTPLTLSRSFVKGLRFEAWLASSSSTPPP